MTAQSAIPLKWYVPFANGDSSRVELPVTTADPTRASQTLGFPPLTMQPPESGGVPPQGEDFNGGMNQVARIAWWVLNGGGWPYDATFASNSNINGYPNGAKLQSADLRGDWINTADNNQNNPDTNGTNWVPGFQYGVTALTGLTGGTVTLTPAQAAKNSFTIAGALTSALTIVLPTWTKNWTITNSTTGAFVTIVKTAAGSGVTIPQNASPTRVSGDGTNITQAAENVAAGAGSQAMQFQQATGRLLRVTRYQRIAGVANISVDGAAYTTTGASTFTSHPLATRTIARLQAAGSGAPGCPSTSTNVSAAPGGSGGTFAEVMFVGAAPFSAAPVTVGAGGAGGGAGLTTSTAGGATTLGSGGTVASCPGGPAISPTPAGGAPLVAGGSQVPGAATTTGGFLISNVRGGGGGFGLVPSQGGSGVGGYGGNAGDGGTGPTGGTNAGGASASNFGAGGAGGTQSAASSGAFAGGAGLDGYVDVFEYA